jgi:hypothetical protein
MNAYNDIMDTELTTISVTKGVRNQLRTHGIKGETYDDILIRLMRNDRDSTELRMDELDDAHICRTYVG